MPYKDKEKKRQHHKQYYKQWYLDNKEHRKQYYQDNKEHRNQQSKQYYQDNKEHRNQQSKQYRQDNKEKIKEKKKQYYLDNKEKVKEKQKQYYQDNKEHRNQQSKQWYRDNKEYIKQYENQRYATNIMYRLNQNMRTSIWRSLKTNKISKNGRHWEDLVGYTIEELKLHLEQQFDSNMTWENHGSYWHMDHIIPLALLTFDSVEHENFKLLWSLGNLQPLFGPDNISKNKKILIDFYSLLFPFTA